MGNTCECCTRPHIVIGFVCLFYGSHFESMRLFLLTSLFLISVPPIRTEDDLLSTMKKRLDQLELKCEKKCDENMVDGGRSSWAVSSPCSCDTGLVRRVRDCNNPTPTGGGGDCQGEKDQE